MLMIHQQCMSVSLNWECCSTFVNTAMLLMLQYDCRYSNVEASNNSISINTSSINNNIYPQMCGFKPASSISCTVTAVNIAGGSPIAEDQGYTLLRRMYIFPKFMICLIYPVSTRNQFVAKKSCFVLIKQLKCKLTSQDLFSAVKLENFVQNQ